MGIYIKDMDMPKKGCIKMLVLLCDGKVIETTPGCQPRPEDQNYKAVPVQPHGRLIDADAMQNEWFRLNFDRKISDGTLAYWNYQLSNMPTIIPAEESEDG